MKLSVRETETIIKILTPAYCPITKASNNFHFHSSHFFALYFPSHYQWFFLSLLPFLILEIKNILRSESLYHKTSTTCRPLNKVQQSWALFCGIRTWMGDQKRIPREVITSFLFHSLSKTAELLSLVWCRFFYFSTICSSFRRVRIQAYYLQRIIKKQRNTSFQFFWLLVV